MNHRDSSPFRTAAQYLGTVQYQRFSTPTPHHNSSLPRTSLEVSNFLLELGTLCRPSRGTNGIVRLRMIQQPSQAYTLTHFTKKKLPPRLQTHAEGEVFANVPRSLCPPVTSHQLLDDGRVTCGPLRLSTVKVGGEER